LAPDPGREPGDADPDRDAAKGDGNQVDGDRFNGKRTGDGGYHRRTVDDQSRGVVEEVLAFEDRHGARRSTEALGDGQGYGRIGRRDDGAEQKGRGPRQVFDRRARV
jgi:hypothetical protein